MPSDDFCLKWNDHHNFFFGVAEKFCSSEILTDVILSCGGKEFSAHKLVLAICSGYFGQLFGRKSKINQGHALAIVYLKDIDPKHMELILNYMYRGEINVQEYDLMGLLSAAKALQVKGLTDGTNDDSNELKRATKKAKFECPKTERYPVLQQSAIDIEGEKSEVNGKKIKLESTENQIDESPNNKTEEPCIKESNVSKIAEEKDDFQIEEGVVEDYGGEEFDEDSPLSHEEGVAEQIVDDRTCPECGKKFSTASTMRRHHMNVHSGDKPFSCWFCDYAANRKKSLQGHCQRMHNMTDEEFEERAKTSFQRRMKYVASP